MAKKRTLKFHVQVCKKHILFGSDYNSEKLYKLYKWPVDVNYTKI